MANRCKKRHRHDIIRHTSIYSSIKLLFMKWAKRNNDHDLENLSQEDIGRSFKVFSKMAKAVGQMQMAGTLDAISRVEGQPNAETFGIWVAYTLDTKMSIRARKEYEIFCGGWLQFYDMEIRREQIDHT